MPGQWSTPQSRTASTEEEAFQIDGLDAGTDYDVEVSLTSDFSADVARDKFRTRQTVPATVRLASVTLDGDTVTGWDYEASTEHTGQHTVYRPTGSVTLAATALDPDATVVVTPSAAQPYTTATGTLTWIITVTNGSDAEAYTLFAELNVIALADINTLGTAGNETPRGVVLTDDYVYVGDTEDDHVYAYAFPTGAADTSRGFDVEGELGSIASDGTTLWVQVGFSATVQGYVLATGMRDSTKDLTLTIPSPLGVNDIRSNIWHDRDGHIWYVARTRNSSFTQVNHYLCRIPDSGGTRDVTVNLSNLIGAQPAQNTRYLAGVHGEHLYAIQTSTVDRVFSLAGALLTSPPSLAISALNSSIAAGDGDEHIVYIADQTDDKLYAYNPADGTYIGGS